MERTGKSLTVIKQERTACSVAVVSTGAAVACGLCCVLPFAIPAVTVAGLGGVLAWFARAQGSMTLLAAAMVGGAWVSVWVQSRRAQASPSRLTWYAMGLATAMLGLAWVWPRIEPAIIRAVQSA